MKEKINYKSKRALIIGAICVALFATVAAGTAFYLKGNKDTKATAENDIMSNSSVDTNTNNSKEDKNKGENENTNTSNDNNENTENKENKENKEDKDETSNNDNEDDTTDSNNKNNGSTNTTNNTNNTNTETSDNSSSSTNLPSKKYIQTGETIERKVSDEFLVSWIPIEVKAITERLNKPVLEISKKSYINNEKEEDTEIHSAVINKDYITYKIIVKNTSEVDAKNVYIYDSIPKGTQLIEIYDDGTENNNKITWIKDVKAGEEINVSFKVRVILDIKEELEDIEITQIDNTAIVDGNETNTTHNPIITFDKEVKVISTEGKELDNKIVTPGTHLKYYINLYNDSEYDGTTIVRDILPEGTSLINGSISEGGEFESESKTITWKNVEVKAGETVRLSFEVTVNKGTRTTVANKAMISPDRPEEPTNPENPEEPEEPDDSQYTNEVKTPVLLAEKTSEQDGTTMHEKNVITYKIRITNTADSSKDDEKNLTGIAKLIDKFWNGEKIVLETEETGESEENDNNVIVDGTVAEEETALGDDAKVEFVTGSIKINGEETNNTEDFLSNIEVEMTAEVAEGKITYVIPDEGEVTDIVRNNLYWKNPEKGDPSRPENPNDVTTYENPQREDDPTKPEKDPNDNDNSDKDPDHPIDTVKIDILEVYKKLETTKIWKDFNNSLETRPENLKFKLFADGKQVRNAEQILEKNGNEWKITFKKLKKYLSDGKTEVKYTIGEDRVNNYQKPIEDNYNYTITNIYEKPEIETSKDVKVVLNNGSTAANQAVAPGTRLRYFVNIKNKGNGKALVKITDTIPNGTLLYSENDQYVISDGGTLGDENTITWNDIVVEGNSTRKVTFDVTVIKNRTTPVENTVYVYQKDPENPEEEPEPQTDTVRTPVFVASKESSQDTYGLKKTSDGYVVDYVVTVTNTGDPDKNDVSGTAKLIDKYWVDDTAKMEFLRGTVTINGQTTTITNKNQIEKIEVTLNAGETAKIRYTYKYVYESVDNKTHIPHDEQDTSIEGVVDGIIKIRNNLYWYKTSNTDEAIQNNPEEPNMPNNSDTTTYGDGHTKPTPDPKDNDNSNKDPLDPIDTVEVKTQYTSTEVTKIWDDNNSENRPTSLSFVLKGNNKEKTFNVALKEDLNDSNHDDVIVQKQDNNTWRIKFIRLAKYEDSEDGKRTVEAKYIVEENEPEGYKATYSTDKKTITNTIRLVARKTVQVVNNDGTLAENKTIMPGTRLRYTVFIVNNSINAKYVDIFDTIPTGTTLYEVYDGGVSSSNKKKVEWKKKKVLARDIISVSFDVTVDKNNKSTVENQAKFKEVNNDGTEYTEGDSGSTNKVRTPVFVASKTSSQDGENVKKVTDSNGNVSYVIDYTIEVKNSGAKGDVNLAKENKEKVETDSDYVKIDSSKMNYTADLAGTAKLVDKFWTDDNAKVEVVSAKLSIGDNETNIADLENIVIENLKVGETAKIKIRVKYIYEEVLSGVPYTQAQLNADSTIQATLDKIPNGDTSKDIKIRNNLYWMNTTNTSDPSRPSNPDDKTSYGNNTPNDPTEPTKDSKDNETTKYDSSDPIDTVEIKVEYTDLKITKIWDDKFNANRPNQITLNIYDQDISTLSNSEVSKLTPYRTVTVKLTGNTYTSPDGTITAKKVYNSSNKCYQWTITLNKLLKYKANGTTEINYMIKEDEVPGYNVIAYGNGGKTTANNGLEVTNSLLEDKPLDVVFVLDVSSSMFINPSSGKDDYDNNRLTNMIAAINSTINTLMTNPSNNNKNRVAIQLYNTESHKLLDLGHYSKVNNNTNFLTYKKVDSSTIGAQITVKAKNTANKTITETVDIYKAAELSGTLPWKCGTYTQLGVQDGGNLFESDSSVTRKPIMILVTDGDPTHYDTEYTNVRKVSSGNTIPANKVPQVAVCSSEYYYYTMKTIAYTKNRVSNISNYEDCSFYTIGIDMKGSMAKMLLNPVKRSDGNYVNLNNIEVYSTVSNSTNKPESANAIDPSDKTNLIARGYTLYIDNTLTKKYSDYPNHTGKLYLKGEEYYIYETERLNKKLKSDSFSNYANGSYKNDSTTLTSQLKEIINANRLAELEGLDSTKHFSLQVKVDGVVKINTQSLNSAFNEGYIEVKNNKYYFNFSEVPNGTNIDIKIEYYKR